MKKILALVCLLGTLNLHAQGVETAKTAVANMRLGWNLGNTLDSNSGDTKNMWIERWSNRTPKDYETAWGQAQTTRDLIHMFKEAGFNAIRVPVTWYPHVGTLNNNGLTWDLSKWTGYAINTVWMKRVKEIVDYVIDEGMYCILNVHHDTGTASTAWIKADMDNYNQYSDRFEQLWKSIATTFKDYGEHLLFEGYNEMTDKFGSWCFASFAGKNNYNATEASNAYKAVNSYAQLFVDAVRSTGGNNAERNLIVNTYACCDGHGNWNSHLLDPLKQMALPEDATADHLIMQVHSYWDTNKYDASMRTEITTSMNNLKTYLMKPNDVPVIIGEWGSSSEGANYTKLCEFAKFYSEKAKSLGIGTFYWMGLSDGNDRAVPKWTQPELVEAIAKGYYGEPGYVNAVQNIKGDEPNASYTLTGIKLGGNKSRLIVKKGRKYLSD